MRDLYEALGVARDADQAEIRKSFKKLARQYHPDLNQDPKAAERFKEVSAAYEVLGDESRRALYDEFGETSLRPGFDADQARAFKARGGFGGFGGFASGAGGNFGGGRTVTFEDLFGDLFGQGRGGGGGFGGGPGFSSSARRGPARGTDLEGTLKLSLLDVVHGTSAPFAFRRPGHCEVCSGEGGTGKQTCTRCGGLGRIRMGGGSFGDAMLPCDACGASGSTFASECAACAGTGRATRDEHLKVRVPPGVEEGQVIRLRGKGGEGQKGGPAGDLLLTVHIERHPFLEREGADLVMEVPISIAEAVKGGRIEVPTPDGPVRVNLPAGAASGQRLRLRGKGVPTSGGRGDLYLLLRPTPPKGDDPELLKLAEGLDAFYDGDLRASLQL